MVSASQRAKINWQCRRGMLELDLMLGRFVKNHLDKLNDQQLVAFEQLLNSPDPDLYAWLMGYEQPIKKELIDFVTFIRLQDNA